MKQFLVEHFSPKEAGLIESIDANKNMYLCGKMMAGDQKNLNQRIYPKHQIERAVKYISEKASAKDYIPGELNHPPELTINLANVSHIIVEAWMEGSAGMGRIKLLNTPTGLIAQELIKGGLKIGVSTRGSGNVTNEGIVEDFNCITVDLVSNPSGPGCYPDVVTESVNNTKIISLAEAVVHDQKAQKYFQEEINKFLKSIIK